MEDIKRIKVVDVKKIGREGRKIFAELSPKLEKEHFGKFIVIETDTGDYFLGKRSVEARLKAQKKYPDKVFYMGRVGFRAAFSFKGR